jgi:uncharacterized membrane protein YhaH (DUF805 family)
MIVQLLFVKLPLEPCLNNPYNAPTADLSQGADSSQAYQPSIFSMKGRIGRLRYLAYSMIASLALMVAGSMFGGILAALMGGGQGAIMLLIVLIYVPLFAIGFIMAIRRVNDMGYSGWLSLLILIPLVNLWLVFAPGTKGVNEYGPPPVKNGTGLIFAAVLPFIVVVGILAAVAIPAYQGYVTKAKAAQEMSVEPVEEAAQ